METEVLYRMLPEKLSGPTLVSVNFEVHGTVQGVYFPRYCQEMCRSFGVRGWVRNSRKGTIIGQLQGEKEKVDEIAMWLRLQGSPGSRIERCDFRKWAIIDGYDYRDFRIVY
uniref:acylphosphatase n=1 Tax=Hemiscolopendra marginata TaxID=943146 RepID=A0A646QCS7_9MYRI